jgi:glycosyltransferase involved in cell wall biosynthesis
MEYMKACTVYLHTCDREGFGNTVVEAMFSGLPVVTTDCGGPVDIIEKDKYGICFGSGREASAAQTGAQAVARILTGECVFEGLREKALTYTVEASSQKLMCFFVGGEEDDSQKNTGSCTVAG